MLTSPIEGFHLLRHIAWRLLTSPHHVLMVHDLLCFAVTRMAIERKDCTPLSQGPALASLRRKLAHKIKQLLQSLRR